MNDLELLAKELPPPLFFIDDTLPSGFTLFGAQPKTGKSWVVLDMAMCAATGETFLGRKVGKPVDVLYVGSEDTYRRLQDRLNVWLQRKDRPGTGRIEFRTEWPNANEGGYGKLLRYKQDFETEAGGLGVVIFDTLDYFQPMPGTYNKARPVARRIDQFGLKHELAIVGVHHAYRGLSTAFTKNPIEYLQGSIGGPGSAQAIFVMATDPQDDKRAVLYQTGKDIKTERLALRSIPTGGWELEGSSHQTEEEKQEDHDAILRYLLVAKQAGVREICLSLNRLYEELYPTLWEMNAADEIRLMTGKYSLTDPSGVLAAHPDWAPEPEPEQPLHQPEPEHVPEPVLVTVGAWPDQARTEAQPAHVARWEVRPPMDPQGPSGAVQAATAARSWDDQITQAVDLNAVAAYSRLIGGPK